MADQNEAQAHGYLVYGRVQGVGFRFFVERLARSLKVRGWVRNREDGSVEVLAIGDSKALNEMRKRLEEGPPAARVRRVVDQPVSLSPSELRHHDSFRIEGDA